MMMRIYVSKLLILPVLGMCFCFCKVDTKTPISLRWEMGENRNKPKEYDNTFYIINSSAKELDKDWILYFGQMPVGVVENKDSPLIVEQISSTHYKMYPSANYVPIAAGDTLAVPMTFKGHLQKVSIAPEGAYMVRLTEDGKECQPMDVDIDVVPFEHDYQWSCEGKAELPYPYGGLVYEQNEYFAERVKTSVFDIFPSVKKLDIDETSFVFPRQVKIEYPSALAQEAKLLEMSLLKSINCTVNPTADFTIRLVVDGLADVGIKGNNEVYKIQSTEKSITIVGVSAHAVFDGMKTLVAILENNRLQEDMPTFSITDYPDLAYRGFMLDVARNFTTKENLLKLIDVLSSYKMSVLHLHLTDDEGWRLEIPGVEELTVVGAKRGHTLDEMMNTYPCYGSGWDVNNKKALGTGFYTKADFVEILRYAAERHMKVIPEIDLPAHARAAIKSMNARYYKYIDSDKEKAMEYLLADLDDTSTYLSAQGYRDNAISVVLPSTYRFVEKVVSEVEVMYKEAGLELDIFHLGGDEVPRGSWEGSGIGQDFMKQHGMVETRELKDYFVEKTLSILADRNIQMAAWQEVALLPDRTANGRFAGSNILSYCWSTAPDRKSEQVPYKLANAGYPIVLSNLSNFYFDMAYNKHENEPGAYWACFVDEYRSFDMLPYSVYKSNRYDLYGEVRDILKDTREKEALKPLAHSQIKGIQGQLWAETIRSYAMIEYYLFPKMYGLVERAWNTRPEWEGAPYSAAYGRDLKLYNAKIGAMELPRLANKDVNFRLSQVGIKVEDGMLYLNSAYPNTAMRYTIDGTEPTLDSPLWTTAVKCEGEDVKAKQFYLGKESVTTRLKK